MEELDRIREYFDDRADASCEPGDDRFRGNREMSLLQDVDAVARAFSDARTQLEGAKATAEAIVRIAVGMNLYDGTSPIKGDKIVDLVVEMRDRLHMLDQEHGRWKYRAVEAEEALRTMHRLFAEKDKAYCAQVTYAELIRAPAERMVQAYRDWMAGCDNETRTQDVMAAHIALRDALTKNPAPNREAPALAPPESGDRPRRGSEAGPASLNAYFAGPYRDVTGAAGIPNDMLERTRIVAQHAFMAGAGLRHQSNSNVTDALPLLAAAVRAVIAQQRGHTVCYYGTWVQVQTDADKGMEVERMWIALEEAGIDVDALVAIPGEIDP